ncbi:MAG TPA: helix-turn-helix transcriptional regulator [Actinomycetota bacterium]|jgi:transcriptional regulator with XRE-family HTH domain|nr:helix-turn-helix transcriptional regulator [Actinomycetota bacterium]
MELSNEIGRALRHARKSQGLTLREVAQRSGGRFKATSVAGYERGERKITVERFSQLAAFYQVDASRLLAYALRAWRGQPPQVIDLNRLEEVPGTEGEILTRFARDVLELRRQWSGERLSLRAGDLEVLATVSGHTSQDFLALIRAALGEPEPQTPRR